MSSVINRQKLEFSELIHKDLPELIERYSMTDKNYELKFSMRGIQPPTEIDSDGTLQSMVSMECKITNLIKNESVILNIDLMKLPFYSDGYVVRGNQMQVLDMYYRAPSWIFSQDKDGGANATLFHTSGWSLFRFVQHPTGAYVEYNSGQGQSVRVPAGVFWGAIASAEEILSQFDYDSEVCGIFNGVPGKTECIDELFGKMCGNTSHNELQFRTTAEKIDAINRSLFGNRIYLGDSNASRIEHRQSFLYRARGKTLAETVTVNGYTFEAGTVLTEDVLEDLDDLPITRIRVRSGGKVFTICKFSTGIFRALGCYLAEDVAGIKKGTLLDHSVLGVLNAAPINRIVVRVNGEEKELVRERIRHNLTKEDLMTAFGIFINNVAGYGQFDSPYELTNRVVKQYKRVALEVIENRINEVRRDFISKLSGLDYTEESLYTILINLNQQYDTSLLISTVSANSNKASQQADMNNLMSLLTTDYKVTTDAGDNVSEDMLRVRASQFGRLDPVDSPESAKIGMVHTRTMLSGTASDGSLTTPYLRVANGEVVSEEPVYLTAAEDQDQYIAEWNETFEENGEKKRYVRAMYNGEVRMVDIDRVTLKQYSQLQDGSPARNCIPFVGHNAQKRLLMACNHQKQTVTVVGGERPIVCTGVESVLKVGYYTARDVLDEYIGMQISPITEYEERIRGSAIVLRDIDNVKNNRILTFEIEEVVKLNQERGFSLSTTTKLKIPYLRYNSERHMYSYRVNAKRSNRYQGDEVVAYELGYNIEKKDFMAMVDYGGFKVDENIFNRGISLGTNLFVGYKSIGGSSIDDGIVISDRLVYDDTLTSIVLFNVEEYLYNSASVEESFGSVTASSIYGYLDHYGLPKMGTILSQKDPVIAKTVEKNNSTEVKYTYLTEYQSGQVVDTKIYRKNDKMCASVILATRSSIEVGDKMSNRCGNKGIVAKIVPQSQMPFDPVTGRALDVVLNPLGIPSRMNVAQLLELVVGFAGKLEGRLQIISPYHPREMEYVKEVTDKYGLAPRSMIDGRTGQYFKRPINVGYAYMFRMIQMAAKRIHSVGFDAKVDPVFMQPKKGQKEKGGQALGEMEIWALQGIGAYKVLNDLITVQSDDVTSQRARRIALEEDPYSVKGTGKNSNLFHLQACYTAMGVSFNADTENGVYTFKPLTTPDILNMSINAVADKTALHSKAIFGDTSTRDHKIESRKCWGRIDLNTTIINPLWIYKGYLPKLFVVMDCNKSGKPTKGLGGSKLFHDIIQGKAYISTKFDDTGAICYVKAEKLSSIRDTSFYISGMKALVWMLQHYDLETINRVEIKDDNYDSVRSIIRRGVNLEDYLLDYWPVLPQIYRYVSDELIHGVQDFDWHYGKIIDTANRIKRSLSLDKDAEELYFNIASFIGLHKSQTKYNTLLGWFGGKGKKDHGKLRQTVQAKRICCSGRATIVPAEDTSMPVTEIGVPISMICNIYGDPLVQHLKGIYPKFKKSDCRALLEAVATEDISKFSHVYRSIDSFRDGTNPEVIYRLIWSCIVDFVEGRKGLPKQVVIAGRQPTLHQFNIRAYHPRVVKGKALHINTMTCEGFNADFDGDGMWVAAIYNDAAKIEAMEKMAANKNYINPKNCKVILGLSQDIVLGVYAATMLKDNATTMEGPVLDSVRYYSDTETIKLDVRCGCLEYYDLVCLENEGRRYLSTAGRILFNSLFPEGFTTNPFSNPLGLDGIDTGLYNDLLYDGLVTNAKSGKKDGVVYCSLSSMVDSLCDKYGSDAVPVMQKIAMFGFESCDINSVTISLLDLDIPSDNDEILHGIEEDKVKLELLYNKGLVSDEDKKNALYDLYKAAQKKMEDGMISSMPRNNNVFIITDSGSRGKIGQIMQSCAAIGLVQKTRTENLETPILGNYYKGISSFDNRLLTYSGRIGVAAVQQETKDAGYETRQTQYLSSGIKIVEDDCGKRDWTVELEWGSRLPEYDRFRPSHAWFKEYLLGKEVDTTDKMTMALIGKSLDDGCITEESWKYLGAGFHHLALKDKIYNVSIENLLKEELDPDADTYYQLSGITKNGIDADTIRIIEKHRYKKVAVKSGVYEFRYALSDMMRSLLKGRVARNLEGLKGHRDPNTGSTVMVTTDATLDALERDGSDTAEIRLLLDCRSTGGICAHCYGLKFTNRQIPMVGENVGIEAAQGIGEPSAQLTMNTINSGGAAGSSITNGIAILQKLLGGGVPGYKKSEDTSALVTQLPGYVSIRKLDMRSIVTVGDDSRNSFMVPSRSICVKSGEYLECDDPITDGYVHPSKLVQQVDEDNAHYMRRAQFIWLNNFYRTFIDNNIKVQARHFEIVTRAQTSYVKVLGGEGFSSGEFYELGDVLDADVAIEADIMDQKHAVVRNSGAFAALCFQDHASMAALVVDEGIVMDPRHCSPISLVATNADLSTPEGRRNIVDTQVIDRPRVFIREDSTKARQIRVEVEEEPETLEINMDSILDSMQLFYQEGGEVEEPVTGEPTVEEEQIEEPVEESAEKVPGVKVATMNLFD